MQFPHKLPKEKGRRKKRDEKTPILLFPAHNTTIFRGRRLKPSFAISTHSRRVPTSHGKKWRKREYCYYSAIVAQKRMETSISAQQSRGSRNHKKTNNAAMLRLASASFSFAEILHHRRNSRDLMPIFYIFFLFCLPGMSNVRVCACLHSPFPHSAAGGILTRRRSHGFCLLEELGLRRQFFRRWKFLKRNFPDLKLFRVIGFDILKFSEDYFTLNFKNIVEWQSGESSTYSWRGEKGKRQGSWKEAGDRLKRGKKKKKKREREVFSLPLLHSPQPHMEAKTSDRVSKKLQLFLHISCKHYYSKIINHFTLFSAAD